MQQLAVHLHGLDHVLHCFILHLYIPPKVSGEKFIFILRPLRGWLKSGSDALRENQGVAVLLHRIDEELLHRNLLHSVTSLKKWGGQSRKCNLHFSFLQGCVAAALSMAVL